MARSETRSPTDPTVPNRIARRLPAHRAALLADDSTGRVVGVLKDGSSIVATQRGLHVVDDERLVHTTAWHDVDHAGFDSDANTLRVRLVEAQDSPWELPLDGNVADVATTVKERVDASVVHLEQVLLTDGARARVALRRDPDGSLFTQVIGAGARVSDEDRHRLAQTEERVRQTVGM